VGGGVGVAPLLFLGEEMRAANVEPVFLLGARTADDLLLLDEFRKRGRVLVTTEDGSMGERGFVTNHSVLQQETFDKILTCGPTPMMKAVARYAHAKDIDCQASLENLMACGLGACLCCVEKVKVPVEKANVATGAAEVTGVTETTGAYESTGAYGAHGANGAHGAHETTETALFFGGLGKWWADASRYTVRNLCVCKDGPVFNTKQLLWLD